MKTIMQITTLATLVLTSSAHAKTAWVEGPLWRAPQATSFTLKLTGKEKLASECSLFKRAIFNEDGSLTSIARSKTSLQRFRKLIEPIVLEVAHKPWTKIEKNVVAEDSNEDISDKLPNFTQREAITGILIEDAKDLKVTGNENSYTSITREAGLEESTFGFTQSYNGTYVIKLENRDIACDLFEGSTTVSMITPAYVVISDEAAVKLNDFYDKKLLPEFYEVLTNKSEVLTYKAAKIGYRTGKILEDEFPGQSQDLSEKQIRELMRTLLNPKNLEITSNVIRSGEKYHLYLEAGMEAKNVQVKLEF